MSKFSLDINQAAEVVRHFDLIKAFSEGKQIEWFLNSRGKWMNLECKVIYLPLDAKHRIKPPRSEYWVVCDRLFISQADALDAWHASSCCGEIKHVREV